MVDMKQHLHKLQAALDFKAQKAGLRGGHQELIDLLDSHQRVKALELQLAEQRLAAAEAQKQQQGQHQQQLHQLQEQVKQLQQKLEASEAAVQKLETDKSTLLDYIQVCC